MAKSGMVNHRRASKFSVGDCLPTNPQYDYTDVSFSLPKNVHSNECLLVSATIHENVTVLPAQYAVVYPTPGQYSRITSVSRYQNMKLLWVAAAKMTDVWVVTNAALNMCKSSAASCPASSSLPTFQHSSCCHRPYALHSAHPSVLKKALHGTGPYQ